MMSLNLRLSGKRILSLAKRERMAGKNLEPLKQWLSSGGMFLLTSESYRDTEPASEDIVRQAADILEHAAKISHDELDLSLQIFR